MALVFRRSAPLGTQWGGGERIGGVGGFLPSPHRSHSELPVWFGTCPHVAMVAVGCRSGRDGRCWLADGSAQPWRRNGVEGAGCFKSRGALRRLSRREAKRAEVARIVMHMDSKCRMSRGNRLGWKSSLPIWASHTPYGKWKVHRDSGLCRKSQILFKSHQPRHCHYE